MDVATWEKGWIWPEKGEPDYGISLGTGTTKRFPFASKIPSHSPAKKENFAWRLVYTLLESIDGERQWWRFYNSLSPAARIRHWRLNVQLKEEPNLDDTSSLASLKDETKAYLDANKQLIQQLVDTMIASIFYFELDEVPRFLDGVFYCAGHIYCRLNLSSRGREQLYQRLLQNSAFFLVDGRPIPCTRSIPNGAPPFRCRIQFSTRDLKEELFISIRGITQQPRLISGLPQSISNLIHAQQLYAPFGRIDHQEKAHPNDPIPQRKADMI